MEMIKKLNPKDIRAIKIGAVCVVAILLFVGLSSWLENWGHLRASLKKTKSDLELLNPSEAKQEGIKSIVPVFQMPKSEEEQKFLFRDELTKQLKKVGIKSEPLQVLAAVKAKEFPGYRLLRFKCKAKCKFGQMIELLAGLNKNPYLLGIEDLKFKCNEKKREEVELDLVVSTLVK